MDPETMQPVPWDDQTMGEIMFRGNIVMKGYLKNPKATEEAFRGGWYHTGDLAVMQPDGYVKIKDRSKDVIISGGENISSIEVEDTLYRHPAVMGAAVVATPDAKWGEVPCAFIELREGASVTAGGVDRVLPRAHGALQGAQAFHLRPARSSCRRRRSTGKIQKCSCCAIWWQRVLPVAVSRTGLKGEVRMGPNQGDARGRAGLHGRYQRLHRRPSQGPAA
jgi:fatty-acyl-CoA synthase